MSIYRRFIPDPKSDVHATTISPRNPKTEAAIEADAAREEAERTRRSKGEPVNEPLPRTFQWIAKLPRDVQPLELLRSYGRVANILASEWHDPEATFAYFDQLLVDRRGNRKGFPPDVMGELLALRSHYAAQHPVPAGMWDHLKKR